MKCSEGLDARRESVMDDSQISGLHNQKRASKYSNKKTMKMGFPGGTLVESACQSGDTRGVGSIPGLEWSPRVGNGNPLHYSWLESSTDRAWRATIHRVTKESDATKHTKAIESWKQEKSRRWMCVYVSHSIMSNSRSHWLWSWGYQWFNYHIRFWDTYETQKWKCQLCMAYI